MTASPPAPAPLPAPAPPRAPRWPLRPGTLAMTGTLALLTALGPLSTDLYLPSLPSIARTLGTDAAGAQLTLSAFLLGFAMGQLVYGPLSDRHGRKPLLFAGLAVFALASIACALAPNVEVLVVSRVFQALGASGPIVLARAVVRDLYDGALAGRELSRMGTIMGLVPAIAPVLGGALEIVFGWRSAFVVSLLFGLVVAALVALRLPETLKRRGPPVSPLGILRGFRALWRVPAYRAYVAILACTYSGLFAFISGSSFVLQGVYGLSPVPYGVSFAFGVLGYIAGTVVAQRLVGSWGLDRVIGLGVAAHALGGLLMVAGVALAPQSPWGSLGVSMPMAVYAAGVGLAMPQSIAAAMMPFPERAGAASSLIGIVQMTAAAIVGAGLGQALGASPWPLPLTVAGIGLLAFAIFAGTRGVRAASRAEARRSAL